MSVFIIRGRGFPPDLHQSALQNSTVENVTVNFIPTPSDALILLDDKVLLTPDGRPHTTPCTADNISPRPHHVVFRRFGLPDHDAGVIDFAKTREVPARWD